VPLCVPDRQSPSLEAKGGWVKPGRLTTLVLIFRQLCTAGTLKQPQARSGAAPVAWPRRMPPSRQERRKAARDAAKRAPATAGAAGAGGAAAAGANITVKAPSRGDWEASVLFNAVTPEVLQQRQGLTLVHFSAQLERSL